MLVGSSLFTKGRMIEPHRIYMEGVSISQLKELGDLESLKGLDFSAEPTQNLLVRVTQLDAIIYEGELPSRVVDEYTAPRFLSTINEPAIIEITALGATGRPYYYCETDVLTQGEEYQITYSFIYNSRKDEVISNLGITKLGEKTELGIAYEGGQIELLFTPYYYSFKPLLRNHHLMTDYIKLYFLFINGLSEEAGLALYYRAKDSCDSIGGEGEVLLADFLATLNADIDKINPDVQATLLKSKARFMLEKIDKCLVPTKAGTLN